MEQNVREKIRGLVSQGRHRRQISRCQRGRVAVGAAGELGALAHVEIPIEGIIPAARRDSVVEDLRLELAKAAIARGHAVGLNERAQRVAGVLPRLGPVTALGEVLDVLEIERAEELAHLAGPAVRDFHARRVRIKLDGVTGAAVVGVDRTAGSRLPSAGCLASECPLPTLLRIQGLLAVRSKR